ncbi:ferredoxin--NADP reductase [Mycobacterium sp. MYCO198283]|uniref:ferredoxin--NADP reductase n=1 Tax=Mycobacterium sp. MYCO198283 TaxID=2883505 RepID=UPI001E4087D1|nr:ferredoxin--NADP reductase [Mycobacterium sp. MYCO198283]MCG5434228.1 ferredoxin--NADP reductase [Mycobacterium sp. MYCO198283]
MTPSSAVDSEDVDVRTTAGAADLVPLRVTRTVRETADAVSLVLAVPPAHTERFAYQAGQFLTVAVEVAGREHRRCYSMSSTPSGAATDELRITVKRDRDGVVSNWLNDAAAEGALTDRAIEAAPPEGRFVLRRTAGDLVMFAGGSGITPVFSLIGAALAQTDRRIRLFYANRDRESIIFADALAELAARHPGRLDVHHHLDAEAGVVRAEQLAHFVDAARDADYYICGPGRFMSAVEAAVERAGIPGDRVHLERFTVAEVVADDAPAVTEQVTMVLDGRTTVAQYRAGNTLLQTARLADLKPPSSCETGTCGTCIAQVTEGTARILNNDALDDDEVAQGWVVTCQSLPTSRTCRVVWD